MTRNTIQPQTRRSTPRRPRKAWGDKVLSTEEKREQREALLFETAARLFNRYGYHGTSMSLLTEELGLTKGALYYYVKDKQDLLYQLHLKSAEATRRSYERGVAEGRTGYDRVRLAVKYYIAEVTTSPTETFVQLDDGTLDAERAGDIMSRRKALEHALRQQIEAGIEDGSIVRCDPKLAVLTVIGAMAWINRWHERGGDWTPEQISSNMAEMLARMLATDPVAALAAEIGKT